MMRGIVMLILMVACTARAVDQSEFWRAWYGARTVSAVPTTGLVLEYKFASTNDTAPTSPLNPLFSIGTAGASSGIFTSLNGAAFGYYSGSDTFIGKITNASAVGLSLWVNHSGFRSGAFPSLFNIQSQDGNGGFRLFPAETNATSYRLVLGSRSRPADALQVVTSTVTLLTGTWYHVAAAVNYSNSTVSLWVDSVLQTNHAASFGTNRLSFSPVNRGHGFAKYDDLNGYPAGGLFDNFRVYTQTLSQADVDALYLEGHD